MPWVHDNIPRSHKGRAKANSGRYGFNAQQRQSQLIYMFNFESDPTSEQELREIMQIFTNPYKDDLKSLYFIKGWIEVLIINAKNSNETKT